MVHYECHTDQIRIGLINIVRMSTFYSLTYCSTIVSPLDFNWEVLIDLQGQNVWLSADMVEPVYFIAVVCGLSMFNISSFENKRLSHAIPITNASFINPCPVSRHGDLLKCLIEA